jgi:predicted nucleic acid-binding protein
VDCESGNFSLSSIFVRLYLDACCLNRPFDNQSQLRVHLESEAVLAIIERVEEGHWALVTSAALEFELARNPDPQRRARTQRLLSIAGEHMAIGPSESARAESLRAACALHALDALHLACAESLHADIFLTTDDALLRAARRLPAGALTVVVANPLAWLTDVLASE